MPLPEANVEWPPQPLGCVYDRLAAWSAWYSGDPDELSNLYGNPTAIPRDRTAANRAVNHPSQYRGGIVGRFARWFWGEPTPLGERRTKLHVPIAGDIAATSADLLFSEPPTLTVDDATTQARLDELTGDGLHATLLEAAEVCAALGGVFLRVCWDKETAARPWLSPVHADAAAAEWRWGRLSAVTFWRCIHDDGATVVRHLERHEPGVILHGVYKGTQDSLGRPEPLDAYPATAGLADTIPTGVDALTAGYVPNMRPNRMWRNVPAAAHLGRSDLAGVESFMDALDETYSSWMRDIRIGKARLIVPGVYLESNGRGQGARFDNEREVYEELNMLPGQTGQPAITPAQFAIRVAEHQATATDLAAQILRTAGYSTQTLGLVGEAAATATEVVARERRSYVTRDRKIMYWRPAIAELLETLLAVDVAVFGSGVKPQRPDLHFGDGVSEDPESVARTLQLLTAAEAASTETKVRMLHPDWDDQRVSKEVEAIRRDQGAPAPDPSASLDALAGNEPVDQGDQTAPPEG